MHRPEAIDAFVDYLSGFKRHGIKYLPFAGDVEKTFLDSADQKQLRLDELRRDKVSGCKLCKLSDGRKNTVFGEGNYNSNLMFIGEAPGQEEDIQGRPFVGKAGQLLTKIIEAIGLKREEVYIANIVKCRPPGNREPEEDEIAVCRSFLESQIDIIRPGIICLLGRCAAQTLLGSNVSISKIRGKFRDYKGIKVMPTFHPSYLLRNPEMKRPVWEDMKLIRKEYDKIRIDKKRIKR